MGLFTNYVKIKGGRVSSERDEPYTVFGKKPYNSVTRGRGSKIIKISAKITVICEQSQMMKLKNIFMTSLTINSHHFKL
jgi:hypothetical protein